jgi:RNA polymerase sigma-70 factor (ECF subfamily)
VEDRADRDRDLVRAVLGGDRERFAEIVGRHQSLVAGVAWRYGIRREELEDVVSEVFIKAYRNLQRYRPAHAFSTWLYRLAANHVIDVGRRRRRQRVDPGPPGELADPRPGPQELAEEHQRAAHVRAALAALPPRYRDVLFLVYVEGSRVEEAARLLGLPVGTIKSRLLRGREGLRRILVQRSPELFGGGDAVP